MKMKLFGIIGGLAGIFLVANACGVPQPQSPCLIGRADSSPYIVVYTLKPNQPACAQAAPLPPETWNLQKYGRAFTPESKLIVLQPSSLSPSQSNTDPTVVQRQDVTTGHNPYAQMTFVNTVSDNNGFCTANANPNGQAEQDTPATGGGAPIPVIYDVKSATFLDDAAHQGGEFTADLTYTNGSCTADYTMLGLYPVAGCAVDADCVPDASGISPDYPLHCDTNLGVCLLNDPTKFPQLK